METRLMIDSGHLTTQRIYWQHLIHEEVAEDHKNRSLSCLAGVYLVALIDFFSISTWPTSKCPGSQVIFLILFWISQLVHSDSNNYNALRQRAFWENFPFGRLSSYLSF